MNKYENLNKSTQIGLYVSMILMLVCLVANIIGIVRISDSERTRVLLRIVIRLVVVILVTVYAFWGYKKPHGNLLRLTMYLFGVSLLIHVQSKSGRGGIPEEIKPYTYFATGFAAMMIAFICGRLYKLDKNKALMIITEVILIGLAIVNCIYVNRGGLFRYIGNFSNAVCWLTLCFAYIARYEEHKAAGLEVK